MGPPLPHISAFRFAKSVVMGWHLGAWVALGVTAWVRVEGGATAFLAANEIGCAQVAAPK
jgi:hypothetical protein